MSATSESDKTRLQIENCMALAAKSDKALQIALTRMVQAARTENDAANIAELLETRRNLEKMRALLSGLHPNGTR